MKRIRIENVTIVPLTGETYFLGTVGIEGNRIVLVSDDPHAVFEANECIDGTGKVIMPGLINAHTHASMSLLRGYADDMELMDWLQNKIWPIEAKMTSEDYYWGTKLSILEMIKSGTTAYADMYWDAETDARAVGETGIRAALGLTVLDLNSEHIKESADELVAKLQGIHEGRVQLYIAPHAPYTCSLDTLKMCCDLAARHSLTIHTHLCETAFEVQNSVQQYGLTPIEYYEKAGVFNHKVLAAHCVELTDSEIDKLSSCDVVVAHNAVSNMKLASNIAHTEVMNSKGLRVALGTDSASSNNNLDMFEEMRTASLLQKTITGNSKALPAYTALRMATVNGAEALGLSDSLGQIKEGYLADLILLDFTAPHLNPHNNIISSLVYSAKGSDVTHTIINGEIVMRDKEVTLFNEQETITKANERINILRELVL